MDPWMGRLWSPVAMWSLGCGSLIAQGVAPPPVVPAKKIEAGLEEAVNWKWRVLPAPEKAEWGLPLPPAPAPPAPGAAAPGAEGAAPPPAERRPWRYEVQKGDAIIKIARKFGMTPAQLIQFNELKNDRIVVGQILDIPTPKELAVMEPPPAPPPPKEPAAKAKKKPKTGGGAEGKSGLEREPTTLAQFELETVLFQVFLDREMFSVGAIDGKRGPLYQKLIQLYLTAHPEIGHEETLKVKALAAVPQPYATYVLRAEDFRFIRSQKNPAPPQAEAAGKPPPVVPAKGTKKGAPAAAALPLTPPATYPELTAAEFLGYGSVWEFVAERFHCDEAFLRHLNPHLEPKPAVGAAFQVPNVIPFEVEKALDPPLQPAADPVKPITAAVVDLSVLKVWRGGELIAVMPLASARPGLRGRGTWTVLEAIPAPRLGTRHEPREAPKGAAPAFPAAAGAEPPQAPEQILAAGPNNPVGVLWLNLAKMPNGEPLAYGLHGTSIPGQMKSYEGIGGFRLANWDIARAVRLLPAGTPLQWSVEAKKSVE